MTHSYISCTPRSQERGASPAAHCFPCSGSEQHGPACLQTS